MSPNHYLRCKGRQMNRQNAAIVFAIRRDRLQNSNYPFEMHFTDMFSCNMTMYKKGRENPGFY